MIEGVSAAILSGGSNSRNGGRPKSFELINGQKVIDLQLGVLRSLFDDIVFVSREGNLLENVEKVREVADVFPGQGPLAGIHAALLYCEQPNVFVVAGDMPFLEESVIMQLYSDFSRSGAKIHIPYTSSGFEPLHAFYSKGIINQVEKQLDGGQHPRIISVLRVAIYSVTYFNTMQASFQNINTF